MTADAMPLGYRIVGSVSRERRLVDYDRAFAAYAACDTQAKIDEEGFLSPFQYGRGFRDRVADSSGRLDVRGYDGPCWSQYVWFDIDQPNIDDATDDVRKLVGLLLDRYALDTSGLLVFFSGSKGFHVGLPTSLFDPEPAKDFHQCVKALAAALADLAGVTIDPAIYNKVQPLRAPNSRHGKTGRHKRLVGVEELLSITPKEIVDRAAKPRPFNLSLPPVVCSRAVSDWLDACCKVEDQRAAMAEIASRPGGKQATLNRQTLDFVRAGALEGDRHRLLYSAAANLGEFGCSLELAEALLSPAAQDSGLPQKDIARAIKNGIERGKRQ